MPDKSIDVLISSGIWVDDPELIKKDFQYLMLDSNSLNNNKLKMKKYKLIAKYRSNIIRTGLLIYKYSSIRKFFFG